jgi:2-dehydropantoate 2-reductase
VARHHFSTKYQSYWWPRRKGDVSSSHQITKPPTRKYSKWDHGERHAPTRKIESTIEVKKAAMDSSLKIASDSGLRNFPQYIIDAREKEAVAKAEKAAGPKEVPNMIPRKVSDRIHILGAGNIGKFVAHSIAGIAEAPPITLLLHRPLNIQQWYDEGQYIDIVRDGISNQRYGFNVEYTRMERNIDPTQHVTSFSHAFGYVKDGRDWMIDKLIVTTKAAITVPALEAIKNRLGPSSTICFLQNGMGIIDAVNAEIFTDPGTRPRYMVGIISHGIGDYARRFTAVHNGEGDVFMSLVPRAVEVLEPVPPLVVQEEAEGISKHAYTRMSYGWTSSSRSLARILGRTPALNARGVRYDDLLKRQFEKLVVNSVINPLSVVFDCANGKLLHNFAVTRLIREILQEAATVICSLPELQRSKGVGETFAMETLERLVVNVATKTGKNISSMLQDVRNGRRTEIDYINGYIVRRGEELGIACPVNLAMVQMVKAKQAMTSREAGQWIPFS